MRQLIAFFLVALLAGCKESKIDRKAEAEKLMQVSRDWAKTVSPDSVERAMSFWADSAIFLSAFDEPMRGKAAIRKMVEKSMQTPGFKMSWEPESAEVSESGDMGYLIEKNQASYNDSTGKQITLYGRAVTIWKKDASGNWKNVVEVTLPGVAHN